VLKSNGFAFITSDSSSNGVEIYTEVALKTTIQNLPRNFTSQLTGSNATSCLVKRSLTDLERDTIENDCKYADDILKIATDLVGCLDSITNIFSATLRTSTANSTLNIDCSATRTRINSLILERNQCVTLDVNFRTLDNCVTSGSSTSTRRLSGRGAG